MTHKITEIKTEFSENGKLANRKFQTSLEFDIAILAAVSDENVTDLSYYKTDVTVTWEDGYQYIFTLDANRTRTFSEHFNGLYRYYFANDNDCPSWMTPKQWRERKESYAKFFEDYQI